jgi:hypothetical protein
LDARNREFDRRPSYFCHSAAWGGKVREEGAGLVFTCSRNPHDKTVVVRRAQVKTKPGHRVNTIQKGTVNNSLGLRSQSWQDAKGILSCIARQMASYTEPDNT